MKMLGRLLLVLLVPSPGAVPAIAAAVEQHAASGEERHAVILAVRQKQQVEVFDAETLLPIGSIAVNNLASHAALSTDGRTLFIAASQTKDGNNCCAVFALRLQDGSMCQVLYPALHTTVAPNSERVFLQRGNTGIDVFDSRSLAHLPGIRGPGVYNLRPSPDGDWLFGITQFQGPSLDIFSLRENRMVRRLPLPKSSWDGAWVGKLFYLFGHDGTRGMLWTVQPQESAKGPQFCKNEGTCASRTVEMPDLQNSGKPVGFQVVAAGDSLIVYEPLAWWFKFNRRESVHKPFPGGIYRIDPVSGKLLAHLASATDFAQLIADSQQKFLYGLDAGRTYADHRVRLLKLDARTGETVLSRPLDTDSWVISFAEIPTGLVPRGEMQPQVCAAQ